MRTYFQREWSPERPTWLRFLAVVCILLVCVMSTVQVAHTHTETVPLKQIPGHNTPAPDDHCPLCVAIHSSALPVSAHAPEPIIEVHTLDSIAAEAQRFFRWRFQLAIRPPPSTNIA